MNTDMNDLSKEMNNLQIIPLKKNRKHNTHDINSLIVSINKMIIGKKKLVKNNIINNIYTKYDLYSLLNKKLFMDETFGPVLFKYFHIPIRTLKIISDDTSNDDKPVITMEIEEIDD